MAATSALKNLAAQLSRRPRTCLLLLASLFAMQISPYWYPTPDASGYLSIARAIAAGQGPSNLGSRQLYLAPGYPAFASLAFLVEDYPFLSLSLLHFILAVLLMLGVYHWARRQLPGAALPVTALATINVELWSLYRRTLSEIAFMALLMATINVLHWTRGSLVRTLLASVLMIGLVLVRQAGIAVAAGFGMAMLLDAWSGKTSWSRAAVRTGMVGVPAALMIVGLAHYDRAMAASSGAATYVDRLVDPATTLTDQVLEGLRLRISEMGRVTIPGMFKAYGRHGEWLNANMAIYLPVAGSILVGWWRLLRGTQDILALTFPFYLGLYILWPFDQATRFTVPMIPLLMACVWLVLEPLRPYRSRIVGVLLAGHLCAAAGYWIGVDLPRARQDQEQWSSVRELVGPMGLGEGVVSAEVPPAEVWMIQLALDRRVREHRANDPVEADVDWMITVRPDPGYERFALHSTAGKYQLWHRQHHQQAARN